MYTYFENSIPKIIEEIRSNKQNKIKEFKIVELTRKYKFEKYTLTRLTDNIKGVREYHVRSD